MNRACWTWVVAGLVGAIPASAQARHEVIRGRVTSDSARGVRAAAVSATRIPDHVVKTATTDADGHYSIDWSDGTGDYALSVSAGGFQPVSIHVARSGTDTVLTANIRLAVVTRLGPVVSQATRPVPDRDPASYGAGGTEGTTYNQNAARRLPPDQAGDLNAIAAMLPGVTPVAGGISVVGLAANQNSVTMNGLAFAGADVPRDALTRVRVLTSTYDPSNGWFSGAQTAVDLVAGNQFTQRTTHWTLDAPALQSADRVAAQSGQRFTNLNVGFGGNGQLFNDGWAYNVGVQGGRKASEIASLLNADPDVLQHAGVAPDSAARLIVLLGRLGIPAGTSNAPTGALDQNVSFIGRIDRAPYDWAKRQYSPTTVGLQAYAKVGKLDAQGFSPIVTPAHGGSSSSSIASLTAFVTSTFGPAYLADVKSGVTVTHNAAAPYLSLPDGRALVASALPNAVGNGASVLQFGGNNGMHSDARTFRWETNAQVQLYPPGLAAHRVKLAGDIRYDAYTQDVFSNQFGSFNYNSLADLATNTPSSFSRTLTSPTRRGGEWNTFISAGDLWRVTPSLQVIYGARVDANAFTATPALNPVVLDKFGLRTSNAPNSIDLSPRLGFIWQQSASTTIRGGIGQFRNLLDASLLAQPLISTGLPGTSRRLACVGTAVPTPDWGAYLADPATIPQSCAGGGPLADASPNVALVGGVYRPQRSWRSNLGLSGNIRRNVFSADAILSLNLDQPGTFDANFAPRTRFSLTDEGRMVYVPASSIVAATGALSPTAGRADSAFGRVVSAVSDLRSLTQQAVFTLRPFIPDRVRGYFGDVVLSYTLTHMRAQQRGFDGAAFGDPTLREWGRGDLDARHQFVAQAVFRPLGDGRAIMFLYGRLQSGLPFTPLVSGDVNGDGVSNDRAFVADSPPLRQLISSSSSNVATCLSSQLGRAAERNSCNGPWTAQLNAGLRLGGQLLHSRRADLTLNFSNPLAGLDQLLHGGDLRGWGGPANPDRTLYEVRGFDAARSRFIYDVNQRFGNTRASSTTLRAPFRLTLDVSVDIAASVPDQMLDRWLRPGRSGHSGTRITGTELARRFQTTVPDPFAELLQQSDSLLLSSDQVKQLQVIEDHYRASVDAKWRALGDRLSSLPDHYDFADASRHTDDTTDDLWEYTRLEVQQRLPEILSPTQTAMLSGWAGQFFRSRDRMHIRLTPRGS